MIPDIGIIGSGSNNEIPIIGIGNNSVQIIQPIRSSNAKTVRHTADGSIPQNSWRRFFVWRRWR